MDPARGVLPTLVPFGAITGTYEAMRVLARLKACGSLRALMGLKAKAHKLGSPCGGLLTGAYGCCENRRGSSLDRGLGVEEHSTLKESSLGGTRVGIV